MTNRICLGTVQFGMKYGINNKNGKLDKESVFMILDRAWNSGIDCFDTAASYGEAESILGEFIKDRDLGDKIKIISKFKSDFSVSDSIDEEIGRELRVSLSKLNVNKLEAYLLHNPKQMYKDEILKSLSSYKSKGLINMIGVSVYTVEEAMYAVEKNMIDVIQIPYNILDQRLNKTDFFKRACRKKITVYARSPYLQGLVFIDPEEADLKVRGSRKYLEEARFIAKKHGYSMDEMALKFSLSNQCIDYIVVGVDEMDHLESIIRNSRSEKIPNKVIKEIEKEVSCFHENIVNPSLWGK